jgi:hypothetical protein
MNKIKSIIVLACTILIGASSCTSLSKTIPEPTSRVNFTASDFALSEQVSGIAQTVKVLGIDWSRLFKKEEASVGSGASISLASVPVIGGVVADKTVNYALYSMLLANPGYDVVFYPNYTTKVQRPFLGLGFIYSKTTVKANGRLGKLKSN